MAWRIIMENPQVKPSKENYPICPWCGYKIAGAMMTSGAIRNNGINNIRSPFYGDLYYHPSSISVYCTNADCNYDMPLIQLTAPIAGGSNEDL
jgi:hypothetical protein